MSNIIITSIFEPTEAIKKFSKLENMKLIVVGDKKTPKNWCNKNTNFISVDDQEKMSFSLRRVLPYNHYSRKMIGYLVAMQNEASYIIDTDDDNIPKSNWHFPDIEGTYSTIPDNLGFVNIYQLYSSHKIWPRGFPLRFVNTNFHLDEKIRIANHKIGVWQGLADEDPDVDAIYRLIDNSFCYFKERDPIVLGKGTITPFNTQNTMIIRDLFPLLYLPTYVTFRFTDILRGLIAQPIMWLYDYHLGFTNATVIQKRNIHNYMNDFISEIPMFLNCEKVIEIVSSSISSNKSIVDNLYNSYLALLKVKIVSENELLTLEAWINDIKNILK
jgi:hypothetical protein